MLRRLVLLAILLLVSIVLMVFHVLPRTPSRGFFVELASARCAEDVVDRLVVLRVINGNGLFINNEQEQWGTLATRLAEIYKNRVDRTLYLSAENEVEFQTVAEAIDLVRNASTGSMQQGGSPGNLHIVVKLITPAARNAPCPNTVLVGKPSFGITRDKWRWDSLGPGHWPTSFPLQRLAMTNAVSLTEVTTS